MVNFSSSLYDILPEGKYLTVRLAQLRSCYEKLIPMDHALKISTF